MGEIRNEPEAYFAVGEHMLAFHVVHGRGRHSGTEVAMPFAVVARWREDLMVYFKAYVHREDALSTSASQRRSWSRSTGDAFGG
jgi:hypothetical protein